jgi:hypothetical protein
VRTASQINTSPIELSLNAAFFASLTARMMASFRSALAAGQMFLICQRRFPARAVMPQTPR